MAAGSVEISWACEVKIINTKMKTSVMNLQAEAIRFLFMSVCVRFSKQAAQIYYWKSFFQIYLKCRPINYDENLTYVKVRKGQHSNGGCIIQKLL